MESWQLRSRAVLTVLWLFRGMTAAAHQPTLFSPHIKPPYSPSSPSLPSLQPLLRCGSKVESCSGCGAAGHALLQAAWTSSAEGHLPVPKEGDSVPPDLCSPYFSASLCSKEWACFSYRITVLYLDIEAKLASLFARTKNVNWNIMLVFCFAKGTKSKTHMIAAIHIYLKDSCHQEECKL